MAYKGSCHCGRVTFEVEGSFDEVVSCNCSHCSRKGYLLWFVNRDQLRIRSGEDALQTYMFNRHVIRHHFCPTCGCAPFAEGAGPAEGKASINVRCLEGVELSSLKVKEVDGRSR